MIHRVDDRLRDEARRYRLVLACRDCAHFEADTCACSLGYPNDVHLEGSLDAREEVVFCKTFELW